MGATCAGRLATPPSAHRESLSDVRVKLLTRRRNFLRFSMPPTGKGRQVKALSLDYDEVEKEILEFIRRVVRESDAKGAVIGLSGGIDSAVVGALCVKALGKENVVGILMPASHTPAQDTKDGRDMAKKWGIRLYQVGIDDIFDSFMSSLPKFPGENKLAKANVKARTRMIINYYVANSHNMLVAGTGDKSEDILGFFTKYGDGGVDFLPIAHLYKTQVRELGARLGLSEGVVTKPASPQLWPGHLAEQELPMSYEKMDPVLHALFDEKLTPKEAAEKTGVDPKVIKDILRRYKGSAHKRAYPPMIGNW